MHTVVLSDHRRDIDLLDSPNLSILAARETRIYGLLSGGNRLSKTSIGACKSDNGVYVLLRRNSRTAVGIALSSSAIASHKGARLVLKRAELCTSVGIGDGLAPGIVIREKLVFDLDFLGARYGRSVAAELPKGSEKRGPDAPLALPGATPRVVWPEFKGSLDEIAGAIRHTWSEGQHSILRGRCGARDNCCHGLDGG